MKMKTYTVIYGEDVPCYAMHEFEAASDGEAIALALAHKWDTTDRDYDNAGAQRIVTIEDGCRSVAHDIPLDLDQIAAEDRRLEDNAREIYEAFKAARIELGRIFQNDGSEILRIVNAALTRAEGGTP